MMLFEELLSKEARLEAFSRFHRRIVIIVMNATVFPLLIIWTAISILLFPFSWIIWITVNRWPTERIVRHFIWIYGRGWLIIMSPFVRFKKEKLDILKERAPAILIANHLSFFDIYCMALLPVYDIAFAIRSWPFRMFWYRPFMGLANYLDVEHQSWEKIIRSAKRIIERKGSLLFFPEGHRSRNGRLGRFYSGAFRLAADFGIPLIPLCIAGTNDLLPPHRWWLKPASIRLRALSPVDPREFSGSSGHMEMKKVVKRAMEETLLEMRRPAQ
ncbi:MAG: lysophospholipid acyltransferase family protein [Thermodesulfobacteriota bacterium]